MLTRTVRAHVVGEVRSPADLILSIAVADGPTRTGETLSVQVDGVELAVTEVAGAVGARRHIVRDAPPGSLSILYWAALEDRAEPATLLPSEAVAFGWPSRYVDSDRLGPLARKEFSGLAGLELVNAVRYWVGEHTAYIPGSSDVLTAASETLLSRAGVCRDFAHLSCAFLRAMGTPARVVSVYAPGLDPQDFHAVVEAGVDGRWYVVDPTRMAPRRSMVRIASEADTAGTAFLTAPSGDVAVASVSVEASAEPMLEFENPNDPIQLG